ncbi:MAG: hypothetical protein AAGK22_30665 [Acidobacteriota bacterium]
MSDDSRVHDELERHSLLDCGSAVMASALQPIALAASFHGCALAFLPSVLRLTKAEMLLGLPKRHLDEPSSRVPLDDVGNVGVEVGRDQRSR